MTLARPLIRLFACCLMAAVLVGCNRDQRDVQIAAFGTPQSSQNGSSNSAAGSRQPLAVRANNFCLALQNFPNSIWTFTIDPVSGGLAPVARNQLSWTTNGMERKEFMTLAPTGNVLYVTSFYSYQNPGSGSRPDSEVHGYVVNSANGTVTPAPGFPVRIDMRGSITGVIDPSGRFLYLAGQDPNQQHHSLIWAFQITPDNARLTPIAGSPFEAGSYSGRMVIDPSSRFLYMAGAATVPESISAPYRTPSPMLWTFAMAGNGALTPLSPVPIARSSGPGGSSHAFSVNALAPPIDIAMNSSGGFVYILQGWLSSIWSFKIDPRSGAASATGDSPFPVGLDHQSSSSRAVGLDPTGRFAYVAVNLAPGLESSGDGGVWAFSINPAAGSLSRIGNAPVKAGKTPVDLIFEPSGRFVYVPNRRDGSISGYRINPDGSLAALAGSPFTVFYDQAGILVDVAILRAK